MILCLSVPGPVRYMNSSSLHPSTITISWSSPNVLGPLIDHYTISYTTTCENEVISRNITANNQTESVELADVQGASTYSISIAAQNAIGEGETVTVLHDTPSYRKFMPFMGTESLTATNIFYPSAPSAPPENVKAEASSYDTVLVTWGAVPCEKRNGPVTGFSIHVMINGVSLKNVSAGVTTSTNVTGLSPLQTYGVSVAAVGEQGVGTHSLPQLVKTPLTG